MRIRHLTFSSQGGAGQSAKNISIGMNKIGLKSTFSSLFDSNLWNKPLNLPLLTVISALDHFLVKKPKFNGQFSLLRTFYSHYKLPKRAGKDVVWNLHWFTGVLTPSQVEKISLSGTVVITLHDMWLLTGGCHQPGTCNLHNELCSKCPAVHRAFVPLVHKTALNKSMLFENEKVGFVSPSKWMLNSSAKISAKPGVQKNVKVIHNPIDEIFFANQARQFDYENANRKLVAIVANVNDPNKRIIDMCMDFEKWRKEFANSDTELLVIGQHNANLENLYPNVKFLGELSQPELVKVLDACFLNIGYSLAENYPTVVVESAARGVPTWALDNPGYKEVIEDLGAGRIFSSAKDLWSEVFISNAPYADHLAQANLLRQRAKSYSQESIAAEYLAFYQELQLKSKGER